MANDVIFVTGGGRLGNQLNNYSILLSFKLECQEFNALTLPILPYINDYDRADLPLIDYSNINNNFFKKFLSMIYPQNVPRFNVRNPKVYNLINKIGPKVFHRMAVARDDAQSLSTYDVPGKNYEKIDLREETDTLSRNSVSVISGYIKFPTELIRKHKSQIREHLKPGPRYKQRVENFIFSLKKDYDRLVGVHMRQGDYKTWRGGEYYLPTKEYLEIMKKYEGKHSNKSIAFIISSDENQNNELFNQSNYYTGLGESQIEHYMEDFIKLMECDIILGPPSTFSQWAAFLGEIPKVPLYQNAANNRFKVINKPLLSNIHNEIKQLL